MQSIIDFLKEYNTKNGWGTTDAEIFETLMECGKEVDRAITYERRWWNDVSIVKEIEGRYIEFEYAEKTGDTSLRDLGWEPDYSTIKEVFPRTETITVTKYYNAPQS